MWRNTKQFVLQEKKAEIKEEIFDDIKCRDSIIIAYNYFVHRITEKIDAISYVRFQDCFTSKKFSYQI